MGNLSKLFLAVVVTLSVTHSNINCMKNNNKKSVRNILIVTGPPGSGKTTFAEKLIKKLKKKFNVTVYAKNQSELLSRYIGVTTGRAKSLINEVIEAGKPSSFTIKTFRKLTKSPIKNLGITIIKNMNSTSPLNTLIQRVENLQNSNILIIGIMSNLRNIDHAILRRVKIIDVESLNIKSNVFFNDNIYNLDTFKLLHDWTNKDENVKACVIDESSGHLTIKNKNIDLINLLSEIKYLCVVEYFPLEASFRGLANTCIVLSLLKKKQLPNELCALITSFLSLEDLACKKIHPKLEE